MRFILAILCAFFISNPALSGGMSGGTGIGRFIEEIRESIEEILGLHIIEVPQGALRRMIIRLAIYGEAKITIGSKTYLVKAKFGQITEISECTDPIILLSENPE